MPHRLLKIHEDFTRIKEQYQIAVNCLDYAVNVAQQKRIPSQREQDRWRKVVKGQCGKDDTT